MSCIRDTVVRACRRKRSRHEIGDSSRVSNRVRVRANDTDRAGILMVCLEGTHDFDIVDDLDISIQKNYVKDL